MNNEEFQQLVLQQLKALNDGQQKMGIDIAVLKTDVSSLKEDVGNLKTDVASLKTDVVSLKTDVSSLKTDVASLKKGQQRIEARIEGEIVEKIRALFDTREVQNEKLDQLSEKITDIDDNMFYTLAKVAQYEARAMGAKRQSR